MATPVVLTTPLVFQLLLSDRLVLATGRISRELSLVRARKVILRLVPTVTGLGRMEIGFPVGSPPKAYSTRSGIPFSSESAATELKLFSRTFTVRLVVELFPAESVAV